MSEDEHTGYEPVQNSAWNGQPTLRLTDVPKSDVCKVKVKAENDKVKLEHADHGSDEFQYMSQECCGPADLPAKPCKKIEKLASLSSSTRKSLSRTT